MKMKRLSKDATLLNSEGYIVRQGVHIHQYKGRYIIGRIDYLQSEFEVVKGGEPFKKTQLVHKNGWSVIL